MSTSVSAATSEGGVALQKRRRKSSSPTALTVSASAHEASPSSGVAHVSPFRNVSACNRCRLRKNRCDQRLPACISCEKAGVRCVGYDPITKREIPRSYVYYLESRLNYLQNLLQEHNIPFEPPDRLEIPQVFSTSSSTVQSPPLVIGGNDIRSPTTPTLSSTTSPVISRPVSVRRRSGEERGEFDGSNEVGLKNLVNDIGMVSVQGASDPRYLGSASGISFARVVFAAVKSITTSGTGIGGRRSGNSAENTNDYERDSAAKSSGESSMRDSFFGLATSRRKVRPAKWPSRALADKLVGLYFEHANPQLPILHKGEFELMVNRVYAILPNDWDWNRDGYSGYNNRDANGTERANKGIGPRELYMMNIVFAIGAGIFLETDSASGLSDDDTNVRKKKGRKRRENKNAEDFLSSPLPKRMKFDSISQTGTRQQTSESIVQGDYEMGDTNEDELGEERQYPPEAYHAAALPHLEAFLSESKGGMEELQAVLLLAGYALLRPVAPGLWYIVGVALRMAVDLGLHFEDSSTNEVAVKPNKKGDTADRIKGRRDWIREMRRRLWWCVYSLDRLVSMSVGRPVGIQDEVVSTKFPSLLPDEDITPEGFRTSEDRVKSTFKLITHHYLRLRILQSEILQVLQKHQSDPHMAQEYPFYHPHHLKSPYLRNFQNLRDWHQDMDRRLREWIDSAPKSKEETGVEFCLYFLELNYWQTVLMLYRPCIRVPVFAKDEMSGNRGMVDANGKGIGIGSLRGNGGHGSLDGTVLWGGGQEEEERIHWRVAEAGSEVLRLYRKLHRQHQVNYTFLATHQLFMSGISFLYAVWYSPFVRSKLTVDDIDFTIMAATSVLGDLVHKCPPAQACKEAFQRMSEATMKKCNSSKNTGAAKAISRVKTNLPGWSVTVGKNQMMDPHMIRKLREIAAETDKRRGEEHQLGSVREYDGPKREQVHLDLDGQQEQLQQLAQPDFQTQQQQLMQQQQYQQQYPHSPTWQGQRLPDKRRVDVFEMDYSNNLLSSSIQMNTSNVRSQVDSRRPGMGNQLLHSPQSLNMPSPRGVQENDPNYHLQNYHRLQVADSDAATVNSPEPFVRSSPMTPNIKLEIAQTSQEVIDPELQFRDINPTLSPEMINTPSPTMGMAGFPIPGLMLQDIDGLNEHLDFLTEYGDGDAHAYSLGGYWNGFM